MGRSTSAAHFRPRVANCDAVRIVHLSLTTERRCDGLPRSLAKRSVLVICCTHSCVCSVSLTACRRRRQRGTDVAVGPVTQRALVTPRIVSSSLFSLRAKARQSAAKWWAIGSSLGKIFSRRGVSAAAALVCQALRRALPVALLLCLASFSRSASSLLSFAWPSELSGRARFSRCRRCNTPGRRRG